MAHNTGATPARAEIDMLMDFYRGLLGRLPDPAGYTYWLQRFRAAQCIGPDAVRLEANAISAAYITALEYASRNRTNAQFVGDLYIAFLRRGGDLPGVQFWIGLLTNYAFARESVRAY